jgi:hypothetical protein
VLFETRQASPNGFSVHGQHLNHSFFAVGYSSGAVLVVIRATANVYDDASVLARPVVELHTFAVVYVRFANVYPIHTSVGRPGAFERG